MESKNGAGREKLNGSIYRLLDKLVEKELSFSSERLGFAGEGE